MTIPSDASKANCDSTTDDPKQALTVDLADLVDSYNTLLADLRTRNLDALATVATTDAENVFTADQTISSSDAGATSGPLLILDRASASPAVSDIVGEIIFQGKDSGANIGTYGSIYANIQDPTDTSEDGALVFRTAQAGTLAIAGYFQKGFVVGAPTGADKGAGTINATGLYINGSAMFTGGAYDSGDQAITSGGSLTLAHGLGVKPKIVTAILHCTTSELGYSVGDEVLVAAPDMTTSTSRGIGAVIDATNITVRFGSDTAAFVLLNKGTGTSAAATNGSWRLVIRAYA